MLEDLRKAVLEANLELVRQGLVSGRVSYYVGMGYMDQNGLLKLAEDSFKKYTPTARIDAQINDWIHATYSTRFTRTDYGRPTVMKASYFQDLGRQNFPWRSVYDDNGFIQQSSPALTLIEGGRTNTQHDKFANHGALDFEPVKNWVTTVSLDYNVETNEEKAVNLKTYNHDANGNPYIQTKTDKVQETFWKRNFLTLSPFRSRIRCVLRGLWTSGSPGPQGCRKSCKGYRRP